MLNYECLCVVIYKNCNPYKGKIGVLNFYLKGLVSNILEKYKGLDEKILIKNYSNCFLPKRILFYLKKEKRKYNKEIEKDMKLLNIKNFFIIYN